MQRVQRINLGGESMRRPPRKKLETEAD
jgi:hypothetical protein